MYKKFMVGECLSHKKSAEIPQWISSNQYRGWSKNIQIQSAPSKMENVNLRQIACEACAFAKKNEGKIVADTCFYGF